MFNHADVADQVHVGPCMGKYYVYQSPRVPDSKSSETSIKYEVTPQLKPVLKALALKFSPVSSKLYSLIYGQIQTFDALLLEFNQRVYVYEEGSWSAKCCYETALEDNNDIMWTFNEFDMLHLLIVSEPQYFSFKVRIL